jgi:hypothetical protein
LTAKPRPPLWQQKPPHSATWSCGHADCRSQMKVVAVADADPAMLHQL